MPAPQLRNHPAPTHSRHAIRRKESLATIGKPAQWIEPMLCRDDAISEAKRIAEEESVFGTGFAWLDMGRWYAADYRPGIAEEIVAVEIAARGAAAAVCSARLAWERGPVEEDEPDDNGAARMAAAVREEG